MFAIKEKLKDLDILIVKNIKYSDEIKEKAIIKFYEYKENGIIDEGNYEDNKWVLYNERKYANFQIQLNELDYLKEAKKRNLYEYDELIDILKTFIIYKMDSLTISSIVGLKRAIVTILNMTNFLNIEYIDEVKYVKKDVYLCEDHYNNLIEFISYSNFDNSEEYEDALRYRVDTLMDLGLKNASRELGKIESIFKFGDIIDDFRNWASYDIKEKYYPLYLWWCITTIIPLRVTEFTLIPYNCVRNENGKFYLKLRRTLLKNKVGKLKRGHTIDSDFILQEVEINHKIYSLIVDYKNMVDIYDSDKTIFDENYDDLGERRLLLLSKKSYYLKLKNKVTPNKNNNYNFKYNYNYLGPTCMYVLLNKFYEEIICNKYKLNAVSKNEEKDELDENQIEYISLMDTRHYAFINLVLNEIEPLLIKKIANHKKIDMSYYYYNHLDKFIKCYTYSMAKRIALSESKGQHTNIFMIRKISKKADIVFRRVFNIDNDKLKVVNDGHGKCDSLNEEYKDCVTVNGECEKCNHFIPISNKAKDDIIKTINDNEEQISLEIEEIKEILKVYNKGKIYREEYARKIDKIKGLAHQNAELLGRYVIKE